MQNLARVHRDAPEHWTRWLVGDVTVSGWSLVVVPPFREHFKRELFNAITES